MCLFIYFVCQSLRKKWNFAHLDFCFVNSLVLLGRNSSFIFLPFLPHYHVSEVFLYAFHWGLINTQESVKIVTVHPDDFSQSTHHCIANPDQQIQHSSMIQALMRFHGAWIMGSISHTWCRWLVHTWVLSDHGECYGKGHWIRSVIGNLLSSG